VRFNRYNDRHNKDEANGSTLNLPRRHCRSVVYLARVLEVKICALGSGGSLQK